MLVLSRKCAGAVQPPKPATVSRRSICDRGICRKPLAVAADAGVLMGFQIDFPLENLSRSSFCQKGSY